MCKYPHMEKNDMNKSSLMPAKEQNYLSSMRLQSKRNKLMDWKWFKVINVKKLIKLKDNAERQFSKISKAIHDLNDQFSKKKKKKILDDKENP